MIVAEILANAAECLIIADFITKFLEMKDNRYSKVKFTAYFTLLFLDNMLCPALFKDEFIPVAVMITIGLIYSAVFLKGNIYIKIFVVFISCIALLLINMLVLMVLSEILKTSVENLTSGVGAVRLMVLFLTKFLYFLTTRMLLKIKGDNKYSFGKIEWTVLMSIFGVTFLIGVAVLESAVKGINTEVFMIASVIGLILINIITYILMIIMNRENSEKVKIAILETQIEGSSKSIEEITRMYSEIQQIRHDIKHWATGSLTLIKQGKYDQAETCLTELLSERIGTLREYAMTESDVVNAIINSKLTEAQDKSIDVTVNVGKQIGIKDEYGLSVAVANLLDNAIEACMRLNDERKTIYYEMGIEKDYLKIFVKNTYTGEEITMKTQKQDQKRHGLGHRMVQEFCEEHDGILNFYRQNEYFCADLWLKIDKI